ncbi:MCE family protein [Actinomadura algeriensis]|uniref:Phospholipid/cholesterol/gamma-HCH transport system substrate-binding protein n=1 Tax=Actinomadura algeriensis TaxID=1679523 RepID=A0ABR9JMC5_9ACTN|nr:MCE family protein [Actinomadura algeriensis]MBE1531573.1 phospholipid/cholesterol/gamma-HCH transport system substrate-binding protein [Actinomadura algeriensis]
MSRTRPVRGARRRARLLGAAALAGVTALSGCSFDGVGSLPLPGGPDLGDDPRTFKIEFSNVLDLVPQSVVKVNDVSVGQVEEIELAGGEGGWRAVVTVAVRGDVDLPDNASARISQTSLLGEKFVDLSPPANEPPRGKLGEGDVIPLARTTHGTEIEQVLSAMSLLLNGGGLEQVSTISHELQAAMGGREATIKSVLDRVDVFVGTLDQNRDAITRALDSLDRLMVKLSDERETIRDTIDETGPAIAVLEQNREDLTEMLVALDKLSRTTTNVINQSHDDMVVNLKNLDTVLRNLNKAGSDLPNALETMITYPFPATFGNVIEGDYGNVHLTVDLDFESLAQNLLGGTDLENQLGDGQEMRKMLQVPNLTLPDSPLGVLQQDGAGTQPKSGGGGGGGGGQNAPGGGTPAPTPSTTPTGKKPPGTGDEKQDGGDFWDLFGGGEQNRPGAFGRQSGLTTLMTGGLS